MISITKLEINSSIILTMMDLAPIIEVGQLQISKVIMLHRLILKRELHINQRSIVLRNNLEATKRPITNICKPSLMGRISLKHQATTLINNIPSEAPWTFKTSQSLRHSAPMPDQALQEESHSKNSKTKKMIMKTFRSEPQTSSTLFQISQLLTIKLTPHCKLLMLTRLRRSHNSSTRAMKEI